MNSSLIIYAGSGAIAFLLFYWALKRGWISVKQLILGNLVVYLILGIFSYRIIKNSWGLSIGFVLILASSLYIYRVQKISLLSKKTSARVAITPTSKAEENENPRQAVIYKGVFARATIMLIPIFTGIGAVFIAPSKTGFAISVFVIGFVGIFRIIIYSYDKKQGNYYYYPKTSYLIGDIFIAIITWGLALFIYLY